MQKLFPIKQKRKSNKGVVILIVVEGEEVKNDDRIYLYKLSNENHPSKYVSLICRRFFKQFFNNRFN